MKKFFLSLMTVAVILAAMSLVSCEKENKGPDKPGSELQGHIRDTKKLDANTVYTITGPVIVEDGGVLDIPAGTTIKAKNGFSSYILVLQGGKIYARGTASNPVKITADIANAGAGYWGGLIINGKAPLSGGGTGTTEINTDYIYGGTAVDDNSGELTYLILENTGARSSADVEHNGLTLNGVGNGTKIENIYIVEGADDGIEFFGGSVNVKNLLVVNSDDDMFDFTQGYTGTLENAYGIWEAGFSSTEADPRGVEADGNLDGLNPEYTGQSDFVIKNVTFDLRLAASVEEGYYMHDVIKVRRGAKATITNALVKGVGQAKDLIDFTDGIGAGNTNSVINLTNKLTTNISGKEINPSAEEYPGATISDSNTGCPTDVFAWTGYDFSGDKAKTENLSGSVTGTKKLNANIEYVITGPVIVEDGGVLDIPAGTTIKANKGFSSYILVLQGGKIYARGTASKPVKMIPDIENAGAGHWGGLIVNGKAPLSGGGTGSTEINSAYKYGGNVVNDNSGELTFLVLDGTGARSSADVEHNGLTLNGVGNGTKIEDIYVLNGADDGIEFFGGSVNVKNLLVVNSDDDMFDFTQGYTGTLENAYGIWEAGYSSTEADPRGVEADGNLDGLNPEYTGQSDFIIKNVTFDLRLAASAEEGYYMHDVIKVRRGAKATITNALVKGVGQVKDLIDFTDGIGNGNAASSISLTNSLSTAISGKEVNPNTTEFPNAAIVTGNSGCATGIFSWTGYQF